MISTGLSARCVVLTGPAHESVLLADVYRRLAHDLGTNGILVVADLSRNALKALDGGVHILKVSHEELLGHLVATVLLAHMSAQKYWPS